MDIHLSEIEARVLGSLIEKEITTPADVKPGDFVLMQFGHNDGGSLTQSRARASLKGNGEETQEITDVRRA